MGILKGWKEKLYTKLRSTLYLSDIDTKLAMLHSFETERYLEKELFNNPKYAAPDKLNRFEFQVFSQFGEDGIIREIFRRIGTANKYFVEFGVEDGSETNTTYLLFQGWNGLWIEGSEKFTGEIQNSFAKAIHKKQLTVINSFITAENIESIFSAGNVPAEFDLLSVDIDRNDYYVWQAITRFNPRVVVIEYNGIFQPGDHFVVDYDANAMWDRTSNYGASLSAMVALGLEKGYRLVGSSFAGLNAFFVREDLIAGNFTGPFTAENYYEQPRYFLYTKNGHPRKITL